MYLYSFKMFIYLAQLCHFEFDSNILSDFDVCQPAISKAFDTEDLFVIFLFCIRTVCVNKCFWF